MGIYFCVISDDFSAPQRLVDRTYRRGRHTSPLRRLRQSVRSTQRGSDGRGETLSALVSRICSSVEPHSLDALLIFAHGYVSRTESEAEGYVVPTIKLGRGLTATTASEFGRMTHLWRRSYEPDDLRDFRAVVPRIELHVCHAAERWNQPVVEALARAARASVFASTARQMVENLAFEGNVSRTNPRTRPLEE
jgi:hypothetical protein